MSRFQQVKEANGFLKDTVTGAIINANTRDLKAYKKRKYAAAAMRSEIDGLKNDVNEIKLMLRQLLSK